MRGMYMLRMAKFRILCRVHGIFVTFPVPQCG